MVINAVLDAAVFATHTQLQRLGVRGCSLPGSNAASLLAAVGAMPELRHLELSGLEGQWPTAASAYTALTASTIWRC